MHVRVFLVILALGGVAFFFGFNEWRLAAKAHGQPQTISAADLEARGPGNNAHIVLSDFMMCEWSFVYEAEKRGGGEHWKRVWVPAVPLDSPYAQQINQMAQNGVAGAQLPPPPNIRIIVKCKADSEAAVHAVAQADTIQGMVVNEIESIGGEEKKLLSESYPGIDFSQCWIVEVDRKPAGAGMVMAMMGGGGTAVLLGLALLAGLWRSGN